MEPELVIVDTGGPFQRLAREHFYDPFTEATGVRVTALASNDTEQWTAVTAMMRAGKVEWDIVTSGYNNLRTFPEFLMPLDPEAVPNAAEYGVPGTCLAHGLLRTIGGSVLAYSAEAFPPGKHPQSWADFWDVERFPGPRGLRNAGAPWQVLAAALLADGVSASDLFPMDLDRAFRKLDEIRPHVAIWWRTSDESQQMMRDGRVVMGLMWSGPAQALRTAGAPVQVEWNQGIKMVGYWSVLKGAPHPDAALAFLNFFMERPEAHLAFSRSIFYDTPNRKARELMSAEERAARATHPANWSRMIEVLEHPWVARHRELVLERWSTWLKP